MKGVSNLISVHGTYGIPAQPTSCAPGSGLLRGFHGSACAPCAAGTVQASNGTRCSPCPTGTFAAANGSTACADCAPGWTTAGENATMCTIYSACDHTTNTVYINKTVEVEKIVEVRVSSPPTQGKLLLWCCSPERNV